MTETQKKNRYYEWVGQMRFLSLLIGETFQEPLKADGTKETDMEILWDFYINYNNRQMAELNKLREEVRNA
jgi:hypothetical protein